MTSLKQLLLKFITTCFIIVISNVVFMFLKDKLYYYKCSLLVILFSYYVFLFLILSNAVF